MRTRGWIGLWMGLVGCGTGIQPHTGDTDTGEPCVPQTFWRDGDSDGHGHEVFTVEECEAPAGYVDKTGDCDDSDPNIHPNAEEVCDFVDNNCDDAIDEGVEPVLEYVDGDGDTYASDDPEVELSCSPESATPGGDCDDDNILINPGASDVCEDGLDTNCDGVDNALFIGNTPFTTLQDAFDAASSGDIIEVCNYVGPEATLSVPNITVRGQDLDTSKNSLTAAIVFGGGGQLKLEQLAMGEAVSVQDSSLILASLDLTAGQGVSFATSAADTKARGLFVNGVNALGAERVLQVQHGSAYPLKVTLQSSQFDGTTTPLAPLVFHTDQSLSVAIDDVNVEGWTLSGDAPVLALSSEGDLQITWINSDLTANVVGDRAVVQVDGAGQTSLAFSRAYLHDNEGTGDALAIGHIGSGAFDLSLGYSSVFDNRTTDTSVAAVVLIATDTLSSDTTNWGAVPHDNVPADLKYGSTSYTNLGLTETFTCASGSCTW